MNQKNITAVVAGVALILGVYFATVIAPPGFNDTETIETTSVTEHSTQYLQRYPKPRAVSDVSLVDNHRQAFSKQDLTDKWTLLFVGYTYCPDICPTTLAALNSAYDELVKTVSGAPIQVIFLSVDPKRDSPERLDEYMSFFNDEFIAVTGEHSQLFPFVRSMGMMYSMTDSTDTPNYLVDHSASVVVINPQAQVIGRFKAQQQPGKIPISDTNQIIADLPAIVAQG